MNFTVLEIRVPRESENTPEQTAQLLASLSKITRRPNLVKKLFGQTDVYLALEIVLLDGQIHFCVATPPQLVSFVQSQILATYPDASINEIPDYLPQLQNPVTVTAIKQSAAAYFPLRDYADYKQVDPMLPVLGILSKASLSTKIVVQFILSPAPSSVLAAAQNYITPKFEDTPDGKVIRELPAEEKAIIKDKISHPLVSVAIRLAATDAQTISGLAGAISVLDRPDGNSLKPAKIKMATILKRSPSKPTCILNVMELSSLWHLPGSQTKIPNIAWGVSVARSECPDNLPIFTTPLPPPMIRGGDSQVGGGINIFATTNFRNENVKFGIKVEDRLRHMYILGKSGTGKSTLLENMAVDDFKKGRGVAFIDPHGDSIENLLNYIPSDRINDTIYFNPQDKEHPIAINILECQNPDQAELVVSGIIAIFHKLYGKFWGPRMQYILRNSLLTLVDIPNSTLPDVIKILSDLSFRKTIYPKVSNKALLSFWQKEFDTLPDETRLQYTYPILNKVGQFVNSPLIQGIISKPKSDIDVGQILDSGKIFLANLSQGKLGEDNATLLGAMLITKFELAAMGRIEQIAQDRKEYFLYVDEFQNFATTSFVKILSEARKFKLGLVLANQYVAQIEESLQKAIFGNVGTTVSFTLGAEDAKAISREFAPVFEEADLTNLQKHQIALRLTIDGQISPPFSAFTLPPLKSINLNREKVISQSQTRYSKKW